MQKIKKEIHDCLDKIIDRDMATELPAIFTAYLELVAIIGANTLTQREIELHFSDLDVLTYVKRARVFFNKWELYLESIMRDYFIHGSLPSGVDKNDFEKLRTYYIAQYRHLVMSEIHAANINKITRVCHVGAGSMPLSSLMTHKYSKKCFIIGLDCDLSAATAARHCVEHKCTLEPENYDLNAIKIEHADGADYHYADMDVVILSSSITNKQQIVERAQQTINRNILLIDRKIYGLSHYIYQSSTVSISGGHLFESAQCGLIQTNCYSLNSIGH